MLYKLYSRAVAKIHIYQMGIPVSFGTGFFIDGEGTMITNAHVFEDSLTSGNRARFEFQDGTVIKKHLIGACGDERNIDLCVIKLPIKPKRWIPLTDLKTVIGQKIYTLGHPRGYDFSISDGLISASRKLKSLGVANEKLEGIEQIQISAPISPGNSGGPVFNEYAKLVGISTWVRTDKGSQNLNFAIKASEVIKFVKNNKTFITRKQWRKNRKERIKNIRLDAKRFYQPAYDYAKKVNQLPSLQKAGPIPKDFSVYGFKGINNDIKLILPNFLTNCHPHEGDTGHTYHCVRRGTHNGIYVMVYPDTKFFNRQKSDEKLFDKIPLAIIQQLKKDKKWEEMKKTLTPKQIKYLHSVQKEKSSCKNYEANQQVFSNGAHETCTFFVHNHQYVGQVMGGDIKYYKDKKEVIGIYYEVKSENSSFYSKAAFLASSTIVLIPKKASSPKK
jgi:hypothetical protein